MNQFSICPVCQKEAKQYCKKENAQYFVCGACNTLFQYPLPNTADMIEYANQEYENGVYQEYIKARELKKATFRLRLKRILGKLQPFKNTLRLLDIGCSAGFLLEVALENGIDAYGVEFSPSAVKYASDEIQSRIMVGEAISVLQKQDTIPYDVVTAFDLIEHTSDALFFLKQIHDNIRANDGHGLLAITTPDAGHFLRYLMFNRWPMLQPNQHTILFSAHSLKLALEKAGFHSIEVFAARKTIFLDYLMDQIKIHNPKIYGFYKIVSPYLPKSIRQTPIHINIGEIMALAFS